jgi:hypothetical protein
MTFDAAQSVTVTAPIDQVVARLPVSMCHGDVTLTLVQDTDDRRPSPVVRRAATWRARGIGGAAVVEMVPLGATATQVEVALGAPGPFLRRWRWSARRRTAVAAGLAAAIERHVEQRGPEAMPVPPPRARRAVRLGVPVGATALLLILVLAANLFAPPKPVTLDVATQRFRQQSSATASRQTAQRATVPSTPRKRSVARAAPGGPPAGTPQRTGTARAIPAAAHAAARQPAAPTATSRAQTRDQSATPRRAATAPTQAAPSQQGPVLPDEGVYRYATEGWEEVDVPGGHREFPSETTQTVIHTRCGYRVRWDPMEERWDETTLCPHDQNLLPTQFHTYRSFFGRSVEQHYTCTPGSTPDGAKWLITCSSKDSEMTTVARSLGTKTMSVDGQPVSVTGLRVDSKLEGATSGSRQSVMWHSRDTDVLVYTEVSGQMDVQGPFGSVHYQEHYTLQLRSLQPHT